MKTFTLIATSVNLSIMFLIICCINGNKVEHFHCVICANFHIHSLQVQSLCKRGGVMKAQMHPVTPAGRKRMVVVVVVLVFGEIGDPKVTHTTLAVGGKARGPGDSTLRYV